MPQPPVPQRVFVDVDVLATRTPFCWLAMLRDETDGSFRLHTSAAALAAAGRDWQARHPGARGEASRRRERLLRGVLDDVTGDAGPDDQVRLSPAPGRADDTSAGEIYTPDEFLCLVDDQSGPSVRALTRRRQDDLDRRRDAGIPSASLTDALVAAGCSAFAERISTHLRALASAVAT